MPIDLTELTPTDLASQARWHRGRIAKHATALHAIEAEVERRATAMPEESILMAYNAYYDRQEQANRVPLSFHAWQLLNK
jgi:hypothetical protein